MFKKIVLGCDHAGLQLKRILIPLLKDYAVEDVGTFDETSVDYPDFASAVCQKVKSESDMGLLICGSGQGMAMRANKFAHIRAALCWNEEVAALARQHNNANVLCLGARTTSSVDSTKILKAFLETPFEGGRHQKRIEKLNGPT